MSLPASNTSSTSPCGRRRYSAQTSVRSSSHHSDRSAPQTGWTTDSPGPPASTCSVPWASRTTSCAASHGMLGWSHCSQDRVTPSGASRASETKSGPETSACEPPGVTRTISFTTSAGAAPAAWVSRTASSPSGTTRKSACRPPARTEGSGVPATGVSLPGSSRYSRWSENSVNHSVPPCTVQAPPPYSCTRVRAFQGGGNTSLTVPSAERRTITDRPPSVGRDSDHHTSSPSTATSPSRAAARTTSSDVRGVGQLPVGETEVMSVTLGPYGSVWDTRPDLPDPGAEGDYRPTHACPHHVDATAGVLAGALRFDGCEQEAAREALHREPPSRRPQEDIVRPRPVPRRRRRLEPAGARRRRPRPLGRPSGGGRAARARAPSRRRRPGRAGAGGRC